MGERTISYTNLDHTLTAEIFLPATIGNDNTVVEAYASYLNNQSATYVASTMGVTDILTIWDKFQIPSSIRIIIPVEADRANFYKPGEVCFYKIAFERGLIFPIDNHVRELLSSLDFDPY